MKRSTKKPLSQQWERLMQRREEAIKTLVRVELQMKKLRGRLIRAHNKKAREWDQSPLGDDLNDISLGV